MTLPVNKRLRHIATDSHPSLLRSTEVNSSLPSNSGQPRKILNGRKSWEEANSGFCSGELQIFWELSASMYTFRWTKRILGKVSLIFFKKTIKSGEDLDNLVRWLKFKNERKFHDHTEEEHHHGEDKQTSMYTLNDNKQRNKVCSVFTAGQENCTVNSTVTKSTYSNQVTLTDVESVDERTTSDRWVHFPHCTLPCVPCTLKAPSQYRSNEFTCKWRLFMWNSDGNCTGRGKVIPVILSIQKKYFRYYAK